MSDQASDRPKVQLPQGYIVGLTLKDGLPRAVDSFRGVPYCLPPTGDRRFRAAAKLPVIPDSAIDASAYGPAAPGKPLLAGGPKLEYSENCLTANVFRHHGVKEGALLPVALYIHGGAFNRGTASMHNTASMVANSEEPFIAISFNYRIGALGFLPSTVAAKEGVLNLGLKDQVVMMEWVRDNVKSFGGDPNNVTLIGLSAGAHSIGHHLMNFKEGQAPLYHRVVIESGAPTSRAVRPYDAPIHAQQFEDFLQELGCPKDTPEDEVLPFLRSVPYDAITAAQTKVFDAYNPSLRWAWQPVIDGDTIPRPPLETWKSGKWHKVPIMTGFCRNEGSLYVDKQMSEPSQFTSFFAELLPLLSESEIKTLEDLYPDPSKDSNSYYKETREGVGAQYKRVEAAYANYAYVAPVRQTAEFASAASDAPVYLYQWALESGVIDGARHGDNMKYEAVDPSVADRSESLKLTAQTTNDYISSFIITGDPNAIKGGNPNRPVWEKYRPDAPKAIAFGAGNKELVGGASGPPAALLDDTWMKEESVFWWSKVELSQQ
ncbi:unnamed protein product [Clonostachys solani]|uniref:Carboxylic ester hydrolase n=1 Tax=Clonostachys solani TaxID=160281 RepID=A0A9N9YR36_9HYPO|nr:unnamed protein product [Clonostachys solani]